MADDPPEQSSAEQSEQDRKRSFAMSDVEWTARTFVANCLRVIAGAGDSFRLFDQAIALFTAMKSAPADTTVGHINDAIGEGLSDGLVCPDEYDRHEDILGDIEQAVLRIVAARLLRQRVQVTRRENDFYNALNCLEKLRDEARREAEAASAARRAQERAARLKARKPRAKPPSLKPIPMVQSAPRPAARPTTAEEEAELAACKTTGEFIRKRQEQLRRARGKD